MVELKTKELAYTGIMLAVCIASQFFKNTSVYITGPIVNLCLILLTLAAGIGPGIMLAILTPITSYIITGNPLIEAVPVIALMIMGGNATLVIIVGLLKEKLGKFYIVSMIIGSILKALFMGVTIGKIILPMCIPEAMKPQMSILQFTFSVVQLETALIASVIAPIVWIPIKKVLDARS